MEIILSKTDKRKTIKNWKWNLTYKKRSAKSIFQTCNDSKRYGRIRYSN